MICASIVITFYGAINFYLLTYYLLTDLITYLLMKISSNDPKFEKLILAKLPWWHLSYFYPMGLNFQLLVRHWNSIIECLYGEALEVSTWVTNITFYNTFKGGGRGGAGREWWTFKSSIKFDHVQLYRNNSRMETFNILHNINHTFCGADKGSWPS